jgi:(2Fe-2S) ferredoxin
MPTCKRLSLQLGSRRGTPARGGSVYLQPLEENDVENNDDKHTDNNDDDGKNHTVLVCGNKTCRRQGALNTLQFFQQIVPESVKVKRVGCLGRCGSGPNVMLLPNELSLAHVNTAAHVARLVERQVRGGEGAETMARTLALKAEGNA